MLNTIKKRWISSSMWADTGPLHDFYCPRCQREYLQQWCGDEPNPEPIIFRCPHCAKELGFPERLKAEHYTQAYTANIMLKLLRDKPTAKQLFQSIEERYQ